MKDYDELKKHAAGVNATHNSHFSKNHCLGWKNPGDDLVLKNHNNPDKEYKYDLSYRDDTGKKYFIQGKVKAENPEQARAIVEYYPKVSKMKKVWSCIFVFKKMEIYDGNGM